MGLLVASVEMGFEFVLVASKSDPNHKETLTLDPVRCSGKDLKWSIVVNLNG